LGLFLYGHEIVISRSLSQHHVSIS
jgi:hypothetical protein